MSVWATEAPLCLVSSVDCATVYLSSSDDSSDVCTDVVSLDVVVSVNIVVVVTVGDDFDVVSAVSIEPC